MNGDLGGGFKLASSNTIEETRVGDNIDSKYLVPTVNGKMPRPGIETE